MVITLSHGDGKLLVSNQSGIGRVIIFVAACLLSGTMGFGFKGKRALRKINRRLAEKGSTQLKSGF
jgi:hypothetical protein